MKQKTPRATKKKSPPRKRSATGKQPGHDVGVSKASETRQPARGETVTLAGGLKVPAILFEGDEPLAAPPVPEPAGKFGVCAPAAGPLVEPVNGKEPVLPEAYGTGRLFLTPRDPHCLQAHWDLTAEQQARYVSLSAPGHLAVRVFHEVVAGQPAGEVQVHPESREWFVHVDRAGQAYAAELGYYQPAGNWHSIAASGPASTPVESVSQDRSLQFATIRIEPTTASPVDVRSPEEAVEPELKVFPLASPPPPQPLPPMPTSSERTAMVRTESREQALPGSDLPPKQGLTPPGAPRTVKTVETLAWTPVQEEALAELIGTPGPCLEPPSSAELAAMAARQAGDFGVQVEAPIEVSGLAQEFVAPAVISSPVGGEMRVERGFWFNINSELVIYGATEPGATVRIEGREIRVRPDGTFSLRYAIPDGAYALTASAESADGDVRSAELRFLRRTAYAGEVGTHPQDPALTPPPADPTA